MQESLCQTADVGDILSDSACRSVSIRQRMHETLYQTADAEIYQKADSGDTQSDSGRETSAFAV